MAAAHNTVIKKLLHDFGALPAELVAKYLTIMFGESMTLPLANQTIYAAVREFVCCQKDGYLLANSFVKIDSKIESGARAFCVFLEFMEHVPGFTYCRPSSPWQLAFVAGDITYYIVNISRGSEYQMGTILNSFGADEDLLKNSRRIGILENGADMSLVPYCGIMQFCTVDDNYDIKVYAPEDRNTIEKAWADVQRN